MPTPRRTLRQRRQQGDDPRLAQGADDNKSIVGTPGGKATTSAPKTASKATKKPPRTQGNSKKKSTAKPKSAKAATPKTTYTAKKDFDFPGSDVFAYAAWDPYVNELSYDRACTVRGGLYAGMRPPTGQGHRDFWKRLQIGTTKTSESVRSNAKQKILEDVQAKAANGGELTADQRRVASSLGFCSPIGDVAVGGACGIGGIPAPGAGGIPAGGGGGAVAAGPAAAGAYGYGHGHGYAGGVSIGGAGGGGNNGIVGVPAGATAGLYQYVPGPGGGMMMPVAGGFVPAVANGYTHGATGPPLAAAAGGGGDIGGGGGGDGGGEGGQAPAPAHAGPPNMHFTGPAAAAAAAAAGAGDDADALGNNNTGAIPSVLSLVTILLLHPNADTIFETARANVDDAIILLREVLEAEKQKEEVVSESNSEHRTLHLPSLELLDTETITMVLEVCQRVRSEYQRAKGENEDKEIKDYFTDPVPDDVRRLAKDDLAATLARVGAGVSYSNDLPALLPGDFAEPYADKAKTLLDNYCRMVQDYLDFQSWGEWSTNPCENHLCPKKDDGIVHTKRCSIGCFYCSLDCHVAVNKRADAAAQNNA